MKPFQAKHKDDQIEKLFKRLTELHNFNNQFAEENQRLQSDVVTLKSNQTSLIKTIEQLESKECESCSEAIQERDQLYEDLKSLENDVSMMKTLVFRLNVQIERYQDKLRNVHKEDDVDTTTRAEDIEETTWGTVNTHVLAPLLNAYEEMIHEKDDLVKEHELEMNKFTGKLKEIIEENAKLHKDMQDLRFGKDNWKEEKIKMEAQLEVCRTKAEVQSKRADVAKEKLVEVLRVYEQKIQAQSLDMDRLQEAYSRTKGELVALKNLNSQPEVMLEGIKECHKLFEELKLQHNLERNKNQTEVEELKMLKDKLKIDLKALKEKNDELEEERTRNIKSNKNISEKYEFLKKSAEKMKDSRNRLKSRLRMAYQWAQKLEQGQKAVKSTWDELKQLESIVKHKEAQIRGLHERHLEEIDKLQAKLQQKDNTIRSILESRANRKAID